MSASATDEFDEVAVCRGCGHPNIQCMCRRESCIDCSGRGYHIACIDDLCHAKGRCMHGDNRTCSTCEGEGVLPPERAVIVPDRTAQRIRQYLNEHPELIDDDYATDETEEDPLQVLCYPAAEAYYHARGGELDIYCLSWSDVDDTMTGTHWYLREPDEGRFIDLGLPTMPPVDLPPFEQGTRRGFITGDEPSKRAEQVLDALDLEGRA